MMNSQQPATLYIQEEKPEPWNWYGLLQAVMQGMFMKINCLWLCEIFVTMVRLIFFVEGVQLFVISSEKIHSRLTDFLS